MSPIQLSVLSDQAVIMREGTVLHADVHLPAGQGPFPALLEQTRYSKDNSPEVQVGAPAFFADQGYAVVIQDVRGRFKSEGVFVPFRDDAWGANRDGLETVEWIAAQPWCNGAVGTIGGSYSGAATANTFMAGHRIRVAATSSSFPRFDRNLNTAGVNAAETARQLAFNTIFHDPLRPSRIRLPSVD